MLAACSGGEKPATTGSAPAGGAAPAAGRGLKIAMIAKSSTNPVFLSARTGAEAAAKELSQKHGIPIEIAWLTPPSEDGQVQAQRIAQAVNEGANAVLISCSDAGKVTGAINDAVARGVQVMTFDSDAPESKRFAFYGVDDVKTGQAVMENWLSRWARRAGRHPRRQPECAQPAQAVDGVKDAAEIPNMRSSAFYHVETLQDAAAEVVRAQNAYPQIQGWAMIGGWPPSRRRSSIPTEEGEDRRRRRSRGAPYVEGAGSCPPGATDLPVGLRGVNGFSRRCTQADVPRSCRWSSCGVEGEPRHVGAQAEGVGLYRRGGQVSVDARIRFDGPPSAFRARSRSDVSSTPPRPATRSAARTAPVRARRKDLGGIYAGRWSRVDPAPAASDRSRRWPPVSHVHQELLFCENLSVAENLCLGTLPARRGCLSEPEMLRRAERMLAAIDAPIDVRHTVGELTAGQQQMLQIASAVGRGARIIVFDEPTSSLSQHEAIKLYELLGRLREQGVTAIYVSHRMEEIFRLCDTV
jgi:hypothetical protein